MHESGFEFGWCRCCGVGAASGARDWQPFALPGAPTRWSRDRDFDVLDMKLDIELDPGRKSVAGTVAHTLRPFRDGLAEAVFDCAELTVSEVRVGRSRTTFEHEDGKLKVKLPGRVRRGRNLVVTISYHGTPRRGLYFTGPDEHHPEKPVHIWTQGQDEDSRYWFPCFDYPNEKQTTEVVCRVPRGLKVLSNGRLLRHTKDRGQQTDTFHWRLDHPHVAYLVMLAVGDFEVHETKWRDVPVTYWAPKGRLADVKRTLANTPRMLTLFSKMTGVDYPFPQYAQVFVQDFIFGGMENTSATTLTDTAINDAISAKEVWIDGLVAHELGHQWFGDLVTCRDWSHGWLNEGFATFMETVWKRHDQGEDEVAYYRLGHQANYLAEDAGHYRRPIVCNTYFDPIEVFDRHLYEKGGLVLHMLENELGEDLFWECVGEYLRRYAGGSVVTENLRRTVEDVSGRNLDWFFDQWVYHGGHPQLEVKASQDGEVVTVRVAQKQKVDELTRRFRFTAGVRVVTDKGSTFREVEVTEEVHEFQIPVKGKLRWLAFDPGAHLLFSGKVEQSEEANRRALAEDPDGATRVRAARALVEKATPQGVEALGAALASDKCWFVRSECATALGKTRDAAARDLLIANLSQQDPRVRKAVASALGAFRHDRAAGDALIAALGVKEKSPGVLHDAAVALGGTRHPDAGRVLRGQFTRESWNDSAWRGALLGLGALRDDSAVEELIAATGKSLPNGVRAAAAQALTRLGKDDERVRECLEDQVGDWWLRLQIVAALALAERLETRSVGALRAQAERDLDGRVARVCKEAAAKIGRGRDRGDDVKDLREEVDKLRAEGRELRSRLAKLETPPKKPRRGR